MEFTEAVRRRRMTRSFTDEPVAPEVVDRILDVGRRGPSAGYSQGVEFVVVTDATVRRTIAGDDDMYVESGHPNFVAQAPVHVVVCTSPEIYRARYREPDKMRAVADWSDEDLWEVPYWYTDAGAAVMLMLLAAVDENVAAAFVGSNDAELRDLFGIPADYLPIGIVLIGHAAPDARTYGDVMAAPRKRRPLSDVVHYGHWTAG
jgi:nitroreductase